MIKRMLSAALLLASAIGFNAHAQMQGQELPLNPAVKHGTLPNGLQYFILHNEEPKERANFYIAQKVGSTLENQDQLGLAHFLEHMAFNGTTNYPGKNMLNYLQSKGIRFGYDINARTGFDETIYNIDNVPTTDKALMDSVLLVLHDWSCEISLLDDEIEAERGVIEEEWRSRNDANSRFIENILPKVYQEYQYQQTPIGKMEVVKNFKPDVLRQYYHKWYRPDQQGIVIVGDFDVAEMEKKVIDLFSPIKMPDNAAPRVYPTVSDNTEPIYAYFDDPELQYANVMVCFKSDPMPVEMRNTLPGYMNNLIEPVIARLINNRLNEYNQKPECQYAFANVNFENFLVSKTKRSFTIEVYGKGDLKAAFDEAMGIVARACKTGFTDSELSRVRDEFLSSYEKRYNERDKTQTAVLANGLIRHFVDNNPQPGIETEYELVKQILPNVPVEAINMAVSQLLTNENQVVVVSQPKNENYAVIAKEDILPILNKSLTAEYEAYVDEVITDPLLPTLPKAGKIKSETAGQFGTTEYVLSNGAKVIIKPTDFKADEIKMTAFKKGGISSYPESQAANVLMIEDAFGSSKVGSFNRSTLKKYLAGKHVSVNYELGQVINIFGGASTVKDLETYMELLHASFTSISADPETYKANVDQTIAFLKNKDKDPDFIFSEHIAAARYANNPMFQSVTAKVVEEANYPEMVKMIQEATANAADYTFIFVGNIDPVTFKPLVEKYIASLPSKKKANQPKELSSIAWAKGQVVDHYKQPMSSPKSAVFTVFSGYNEPYTIENVTKISTLGQILNMIYTETLREEMGGTYSPYAGAFMNAFTSSWAVLYTYETNADMLGKMEERANAEFEKLLSEGASTDMFNKVKESTMKQYEINVRKNDYWLSNLRSYQLGYDLITNHKSAIEGMTLDTLNSFMRNLYDGKNRVQVIMEGVEEK